MRFFSRLIVLAVALGSVTGVVNADPDRKRASRDANTCLTCHLSLPDKKLRAVAEQYEQSVHRDERIGCVGCHKGDPTDPTVHAHDLSLGFVVRPPHEQIAELCGTCHEDPVFVRRFNALLPIDQRKLYELSVHGKLTLAADQSAPACTNCHGTHDIVAVASPQAQVNKRHVVELCSKCHTDGRHMAPYNLRTDQTQKWRLSSHGQAFLSGNDNAPTCTGCHSPHAGTLPGTIAVAAFCGRCHEDEQDHFLKSPHARAFRSLGLGECVPCHGYHDVSRSSWLAGMTPDSACSSCHSLDEKPKLAAQTIGRLLASVNKRQHRAGSDVEQAKRVGLYVPEASFALDKLRTGRLRLATTVHALDVDTLAKQVKDLEAIADEAERVVAKARLERHVERRGYFVALGVAGLLFLLLVLKAVELSRRRSRSAS